METFTHKFLFLYIYRTLSNELQSIKFLFELLYNHLNNGNNAKI